MKNTTEKDSNDGVSGYGDAVFLMKKQTQKKHGFTKYVILLITKSMHKQKGGIRVDQKRDT